MTHSFQKYLEDAGFNLVKLPKDDLTPLQLLSREKAGLERIGNIDDLFIRGDYPKPPIHYNVSVPDELKGANDSLVKAKAGLKFLDKFLEFLGIKGGGANASLEDQENLNFEFIDPELDEVLKLKLDSYINNAKILDTSKTYVERLKEGNIYVITQVIKSKGILITSGKENKVDVDMALPEVKNAISGEFQISRSNNKNLEVRYNGPKKLVFAVQAARLIYHKDGSFRLKSSQGETVRHDGFAEYYSGEELLEL